MTFLRTPQGHLLRRKHDRRIVAGEDREAHQGATEAGSGTTLEETVASPQTPAACSSSWPEANSVDCPAIDGIIEGAEDVAAKSTTRTSSTPPSLPPAKH